MLHQLLTIYQTRKDTLTASEQEIAARICFCCVCGYYWVRRFNEEPKRCPHCKQHGWNRPLIHQMISNLKDNLTSQIIPKHTLPPKQEGGNQS
jgi:hypothetical protein